MSIALIAKDDVPVVEISNRLSREGVEEISAIRLDAILYGGETAAQSDIVILILTTQDLVNTGDLTNEIRKRLGQEQSLVLCMPRPIAPQLLLKHGADEIIRPAALDEERIVERILGHLIRERRIKPYTFEALRGATRSMRDLYLEIEEYAPLTKPVLILGESGTGKDLVARALHERSGRHGRHMPIHCAAMTRGVAASELFGHLKGSYTGAGLERKGLIEASEDGTAFFDEIGDLTLGMQVRLLDVVEQNRVLPVGANYYRDVNARFIFATHRDLEDRIDKNLFRLDLFHRISGLVLKVPRLADHMADIPLLADHFVQEFNQREKRSVKIQAGAVDILFRHQWKGNARELRNVVDRAAAKSGAEGFITENLLLGAIAKTNQPREVKSIQPGSLIEVNSRTGGWQQLREKVEYLYFKSLVAEAGNIEEAVKLSGLGKSEIYRKLEKHGLSLNSRRNTFDSH
jgi:DNA-binding NtrC family response regulator